MTRVLNPAGIGGPEGVIAAVISRAVNDVLNSDDPATVCDALAYFGGPTYKHHITALGRPGDVLPVLIQDGATVDRSIDTVLRLKHDQKTNRSDFRAMARTAGRPGRRAGLP